MLAERGDPSLEKSYLPHDKQYLVTRGVPCPRRASAVAEALAPDRWALFTPADGVEGDWVETNLAEPPIGRRTTAAGEGSAGVGEEEDEDDGGGVADLTGSGSGLDTRQQHFGITTAASAGIGSAAQAPAAPAASASASAAAASTTVAAAGDGDDDEYDDLSAFVGEALMVSDPAAVPVPVPLVVPPPAPAPQAALPTGTAPASVGAAMTTTAAAVGSAPVAGISGSAAAAATAGRHAAARQLQARKYDISITYDRYYQTPRVYLKGWCLLLRQYLTIGINNGCTCKDAACLHWVVAVACNTYATALHSQRLSNLTSSGLSIHKSIVSTQATMAGEWN